MTLKQRVTIELVLDEDNFITFGCDRFQHFELGNIIQGRDLINFFQELNKFDITDYSAKDWKCVINLVGVIPHKYKFIPVI